MTLTLNLPKSLEDFITLQIASGQHASAEEYIQALLRKELQHQTREKIEDLLLEGLNSGEPVEADSTYWEEKHHRLSQRFPEQESV